MKEINRITLATTCAVFAKNSGHSTKGDYLELTLHLGALVIDSSFGFWLSGTCLQIKHDGHNVIIRIPIKEKFTTYSPASMGGDGRMEHSCGGIGTDWS